MKNNKPVNKKNKRQKKNNPLQDPAIQAILRDPDIREALQTLQTNPAAGRAIMGNPDIKQKINKLIKAGVLRTTKVDPNHPANKPKKKKKGKMKR
jgi:stress-induced-phosphoprotein 1